MSRNLIHVGISRAFHNKALRPGYTVAAWGSSFAPVTFPLAQLVHHLLGGDAFAPGYFQGCTRKNATFISMQVFAIDADDHISVADMLAIPFVREHAFLIYPTASSSDSQKRSRALFLLSEPVEGVERARTIARAISAASGLPIDPASFKPAQPYMGSTNRIEQPYINLDAVLPISVAAGWCLDPAWEEMTRALAPKPRRQTITGARAEAYTGAKVNSIIDEYMAIPGGTGQRHEAFVKLALRLIGMLKGGHPCEGVQLELERVGRATDRQPREIADAIKWAEENAQPEALELPEPEPPCKTECFVQQSSRHFPSGVPDSWRSTLLRYAPDAALPFELLNAAIEADQIDPDHITRSALKAASLSLGWGLTSAVIDRGFARLAGLFFANFPTDLGESVGNSGKKGRRAEAYSLLHRDDQRRNLLELATPAIIQRRYPVQQQADRPPVAAQISPRALIEGLEIHPDAAEPLAAKLEQVSRPVYAQQSAERRKARNGVERDYHQLDDWLHDETSAALPAGWSIRNLQSYRTAVLRAWKLRYPDASWLNGNSKTARALGITARSVESYLERAGVDIEGDRREERAIVSPHNIRQQIYAVNQELGGRPIGVRVVTGQQSKPPDAYKGVQQVADLLAVGAEVYVIWQLPNKHTALEDAAPPVEERRTPTVRTSQDDAERDQSQAAPVKPQRRTAGYTPEWVRGQIILRFKALRWIRDTGFFNPQTGEVLPFNCGSHALLLLLLDSDVSDPLIQTAQELGALVRKLG